MNNDYFSDGSVVSELIFSADLVTFVITNDRNGSSSRKTGTYTYNPPSISVIVDGIYSQEPGTIDGDTMTIGVISGDIIMPLEFKKQ